MRIVQVLHHFPAPPTGGVERTVLALSRAMVASGHEVVIVAGSLDVGPSRVVREDLVEGLRVFRIPREDLWFESWEKAWSPEVGASFADVLCSLRPDVVHVHHWIRLTTDLVRIARRVTDAVVACTLHDYWTQLATPARQFGCDTPVAPSAARWMNEAERGEAFAFHRADLAAEIGAAHLRFAPSSAHAAGLAELADCDPDATGAALEAPLVVASPPPLLTVPRRRGESRQPRGHTLLFWGSVYPEKGLDVALDALASVGGWRLVVLGEIHDPVLRERLHARSARLPVEFRGAFGAADLETTDADYALIPSTSYESYGLVIDEARCLGLPLIASDLAAYREHADSRAAAFFEPGDPGSLAMLLCDEARLQSLAMPEAFFVRAEDAAAGLLAAYAGVSPARRVAEPGPEPLASARAALLFRRAERRLWSVLQVPSPKLAPDGYLTDPGPS